MQVQASSAIERGIGLLCRIVLWLSTAAIFFILVVNTVLRYATGSSLQWANEVPELLFPWLVMAGVLLAAQSSAHIATTFLMEALPQRWKRWLATASWGVVAALYGTLTVATWRLLPIVRDEKSPILGVPGSVTYGCVMGGMALLAVMAVRSAAAVWKQPEQPPAASDEPRVPVAHW